MTQEPVMVLPNGDILRKGDYAQLYNGKIVGPLKYRPKTEPHWKLAGIWYMPDGAFYPWGSDSGQDVLAKAVWSTNGEKPMTDTPKLWKDMTPEEKGALLLAHHEGKVIEASDSKSNWHPVKKATWFEDLAYRIKPEPQRETVVLYWKAGMGAFSSWARPHSTHRITFDAIDGKPEPSSIKIEEQGQ
jgi:hypothetical protein